MKGSNLEGAAAGTDTPEPAATGLDEHTLYELLSSSRRRAVIEYLADLDGPATKYELAEQVASLVDDASHEEVSESEKKSAYVSLHQTHLPALQEHGLVEQTGDGELVGTDRCRHVAEIILAVRRLNGGGADA